MCRLYPTVCAALHVGGSAIRSTSTYRDKLVTVHKYTLRLGSSQSHGAEMTNVYIYSNVSLQSTF